MIRFRPNAPPSVLTSGTSTDPGSRPCLPPTIALVTTASLLCLSGCRGEAPAGPSFSQRDSAGIAIAENEGEPPSDGGGWAISSEPTLQIGSMEGEDAYLLFRIWGTTRLSDGRIAAANYRAPDVRVFDAEGRHLRTFGRRGEGPEEFNGPVLVGTIPGDTLVVVDRRLRRVNLYHPDEGFIRGATATPDIEGSLFSEGMFSSGSVLIYRTEWTQEMPKGLFRFPIRYRAVGLDGSLERDYGEFPGRETLFSTQRVDEAIMTLSAGPPFGKYPSVAVAGDRFFYGSQDAYEIQVWNRSGALERLIRRDKAPQPVTDDHVSAVMEDMIDEADDSDQTRQFRRMFREAPIPELHPAHGELYADALGYLWVEEYRLPGDEIRTTTIFDPEGRMVGSVVLPGRFQVFEIGEDYLLGRWVDDLGVEYLRMYGLARPA